MEKFYFTVYNSTAPEGLFDCVEAESQDEANDLIHKIYYDALIIVPNGSK